MELGIIFLAIILLLLVMGLLKIKCPWYIIIILPILFFLFYFKKCFTKMLKGDIISIIVNYVAIMATLAILFSFIYLFVFGAGGGYLKFGECDDSFQQGNASTINSSTNYFYFSVVTITTLGYGDICPMGKSMRLIAGIEAICGLLWNVVIMGMVIGFYLRKTFYFTKSGFKEGDELEAQAKKGEVRLRRK